MLNKLFFLILICSTSLLWGQEVTFQAKANKTEISVNERFSVQFILTVNETNFSVDQQLKLPNFSGLHQLAESQISSFKIINRSMINQSGVEVILVADKEGEYTIGSASITIDGKKYTTTPIKITVKKGLKPKVNPNQRLQNTFLRTEVSTEHPYVNQEVILVVKIYARDYAVLNRLRNLNEPDFANLIVKYVSERPDDIRRQETINGQTYVSQELARFIVFPQKAGEIEIDPFSLDVIVSGFYGSEVIQLTSQPITLKTKELPSGKPKNFSGAVGDFKLNTVLSKKETKANNPVNIEVEIIGAGNLNSLHTPKPEFSEHLETYKPTKRDAYDTRPSGVRGKIVENYVIVPRYGGDYEIGPIKFSYFNPTEEKYITLATEAMKLKVEGPKAPTIDEIKQDSLQDELLTDHQRKDSTGLNQILVLPEKINDVKEKVVNTVSENNSWIWILTSLVVFSLIFYLVRNKNKKPKENSPAIERSLFKAKINDKLNALENLAKNGNAEEFYSLQEQILTELAMHFTHTNLAEFTEHHVTEKLAKNFNPDLANRWKNLLLNSKQAKYSNLLLQNNLTQMQAQIQSIAQEFFSHK